MSVGEQIITASTCWISQQGLGACHLASELTGEAFSRLRDEIMDANQSGMRGIHDISSVNSTDSARSEHCYADQMRLLLGMERFPGTFSGKNISPDKEQGLQGSAEFVLMQAATANHG